ncbi:hypothetical protein ULG90_02860 [Halopseudomonas pachastrellae]|nr:hypothetical protein ULG90_02860 [Halopseudomonas pachastrellae]
MPSRFYAALVGFTDDLGVFASALAMVAMYIDRDVQIQARERRKLVRPAYRGSIRRSLSYSGQWLLNTRR